VTLLFPRISRAPQSEPEPQEPRRAGGRVLLVEDTAEVAQVSRDYLERMGHSVELAVTGADALKALDDGGVFDIVLSDIVMPGGVSGLDLALRVRERFPDLPIVLVTGYSESADAARGAGFEVLRKPYNVAHLAQVISAHLARRDKLAQSA
jgi:CheY-like chemotaxis protein